MLRPSPSVSDVSIEQAAGAINGMIAERAKEALEARQAEPANPALPKPHEPGVYFGMSSAEYHADPSLGVYFGMSSAEYHADPSLGGSHLKRLLISPLEYWWQSHLNPAGVDDDTLAKRKGRALHVLVLEGEAAFGKAFAEEPSPEGFPGCLVTQEDLKARCRDLGEPVSGSKAELAKRIKAKDLKAIIFDDILATFRAMVARDGLEVLKPDGMREVREGAASIGRNPHLARAFSGGVSEVSVFWRDEDGVPCKARFDYLKPRTIADLKKIANARSRPFPIAMRLAIAEYRYDLSARHYLDGYAYLHDFAAEGRVFGDCPLRPDWGQRIAAPHDMRWTWVFHQTDGAPVTEGLELLPGSRALNRAAREIHAAKRTWLAYMEKYGTAPWVSDAPIATLTEAELPFWLREDVEVA